MEYLMAESALLQAPVPCSLFLADPYADRRRTVAELRNFGWLNSNYQFDDGQLDQTFITFVDNPPSHFASHLIFALSSHFRLVTVLAQCCARLYDPAPGLCGFPLVSYRAPAGDSQAQLLRTRNTRGREQQRDGAWH